MELYLNNLRAAMSNGYSIYVYVNALEEYVKIQKTHLQSIFKGKKGATLIPGSEDSINHTDKTVFIG